MASEVGLWGERAEDVVGTAHQQSLEYLVALARDPLLKGKREIIRCRKRYVAREVYRVLISGARSLPTSSREEAQIAAESNAA